MPERFTLGIEQEFQLVDRQTGDLCSCIDAIRAQGEAVLGEKMKPESKQAAVELITGVCPTIAAARQEIATLKAQLKQIVMRQGMALIGADTHPTALWQDQKTTQEEHYQKLEEDL
jgi:carboxylate-amine ligase